MSTASSTGWPDDRSGNGPVVKLRVISDVHGNIHALERVLADPAGASADMTICLGDVVGYGAFPSECIALVREICGIVVAGNHDLGVAGALPTEHFNTAGASAISWIRPQMTAGELEWLEGLPLQASHDTLFLCHSDPSNPGGWIYIRDAVRAGMAMEVHPGQVCLIGHTHMPGYWTMGGGFSEKQAGILDTTGVLNCGSVGQPRDRDPRAAYMILDTDKRSWMHARVEYDIAAAAGAIIEAGLPSGLAERLFIGR